MTGDKVFKTIRESSLYTYNEIEKLIGRSEAIKRLAANYRGIAEEPPNFSSNCLLIGKGSIGKTLVGMYFGRGFRRIVIEGNIPLFIEYINCIHFRSKNQIFRELIAKHLYLIIERRDKETQSQLFSKLKQDNRFILLILDEIHLLKSEEILEFLTITKEHPTISTLMICRTQDWLRIKKDKFQFDEIIELQPYSFNEVFDILKYRSETAFQKDVITDDLLKTISQIVVDNENMRNGLEILRKSSSLCVKKGLDQINADIVEETSKEIYPNFRNNLIEHYGTLPALKEHELLTLFGVVRSIIEHGKTYTLIDDAYEEYKKICEEYQNFCDYIVNIVRKYYDNDDGYDYESYFIKQVAKSSFKKIVLQLVHLKMIVSKMVRDRGQIRTRHLEISMVDISETKLSVLLKESLDILYKSPYQFVKDLW